MVPGATELALAGADFAVVGSVGAFVAVWGEELFEPGEHASLRKD